MPNWCDNNLYISGPEDSIKKFKVTAKGPTSSYNDYNDFRSGTKWPINDDIRVQAMNLSLPDPGPIQEFSFHALFPVPDEIRKLPYDCNRAKEMAETLGLEVTQGGYSWENENWGCKWGASESSLFDEEKNFLHYGFDTPWGPPIAFLEKVAKDWPELTFEIKFSEPGMNFEGKAIFEDGEEVYHECWEMEHDEEDSDEE